MKIDSRHIENGFEIPSEGYCDQPYVVVNADGSWTCTITTGKGIEGKRGQHIVAYRSLDQGHRWEGPFDIEPDDGPEASWVMPLLVPETGRIYAFYTYNRFNQREVKTVDGGTFDRVDSLGVYAYRYSEDQGRTWSHDRYEIPMRTFTCDEENAYGGNVNFFWGVGKPFIHEGRAYVCATKVGGFGPGFFARNEGVLFASDNLVAENDPGKHSWETLPEGKTGLKTPQGGGPIAGEFNVTPMTCGKLYGTYRTIDGYSCHATSEDGGKTWSQDWMTYGPGKRRVKNPRAANFVRRFKNGKYLYWFHFHGGEVLKRHPEVHMGAAYEARNPVWICGGVERNGRIHWSEPEILLYDDEAGSRMSYPDFIEDGDDIFVTETQKTVARIHPIDPTLLASVWNQAENNSVARSGLILEVAPSETGQTVAMPTLPKLHDLGCAHVDGNTGAIHETSRAGAVEDRGGFSIELSVCFDDLTPWQVVLDSRDEEGLGLLIQLDDRGAIRLEINGRAFGTPGALFGNGGVSCLWASDAGLIRPGSCHQVLFTVDAGPKLISVLVDGVLCDGGTARRFGWGRYDPRLTSANGKDTALLGPTLNGTLKTLRFYNRPLLTSEGVGNWQAFNKADHESGENQ